MPETEGMRALFVIGAALALLSGGLAWRWVAEPSGRVERHRLTFVDIHWRVERLRYLPMRLLYFLDLRKHTGRPRRGSPALSAYLATVFLLFSGFTAFYAVFPVFLRDSAGLTTAQVFGVFVASQAASALAYGRVGRWVAALGGRRVQALASGGRALLFPAFLAAPLLPGGPAVVFATVLALHAVVGLCWAVINVAGSTVVSTMARPEDRSAVLGAFNAVQGCGSILGPIAGGFAAHLFGLGAGIFAASGLVAAGLGLLVAPAIAAHTRPGPVRRTEGT